MRVAAVQMAFAPTIGGNLGKIRAAIAEAARRKADAVLFPECATTGYSCDFRSLRPGEVRDALAAIGEVAHHHAINVLVGTPLFAGKKLHNALVVIDRKGRPVHAYAKCQLTDLDRRVFAPGDAVALFKIDGVPATAIVCHERRYPELVRLGVMAGARICFHSNAGLDTLAVSDDDVVALSLAREPFYRQAHLTIDTSGRTIDQVVADLVAALREAPHAAKL